MRRAGSSLPSVDARGAPWPSPAALSTSMSSHRPQLSLSSVSPPVSASNRWKLAFFALVALYAVVALLSLPRAPSASNTANLAAIAVPQQPRLVLESVRDSAQAQLHEQQEMEELPTLEPGATHHEDNQAANEDEGAELGGGGELPVPEAVANAIAQAHAVADAIAKADTPDGLLSLAEAIKVVQPARTQAVRATFPMLPKPNNEHVSAAMDSLRNPADRSKWVQQDFEAEVDRLRELEADAREQVARLQTVIDAANKLVNEENAELEEIATRNTIDLRHHSPRQVRPHLECLGWKQTGACSPVGKREPDQDKKCAQLVTGGVSGYCELLDRDTGEHLRVMQLNCSSVRSHVSFSCAQAADFANFGVQSQDILDKAMSAPRSELVGSTGTGNGIVMVVYPKLMTSAYASISVLRRDYGCHLPIELWVSEAELVRTPSMRDSLELLQKRFSDVHVQRIKDPSVYGFNTKIHAVYHSSFENVLFLDADNVPVRDPTYLFESREFRETGAVFWPDFWHPKKTIFNIHAESLLWELVDMEFVDMFEQESGQLLIDRRRAAVALEVLMFYQYHRPNHFDKLVLAHGDKDLFRLAWLKAQTPFFMMPYPPGAAGSVRKNVFCGMTMVQYDAEGRVLFLHRNARKLLGKVDHMDGKYWEFLQSFSWEDSHNNGSMLSYEDIKEQYIIGIQGSAPHFKEFESCYGAEPEVIQNFNLTRFSDMPFKDLEDQLVNYAHEAALLAQEQATQRG